MQRVGAPSWLRNSNRHGGRAWQLLENISALGINPVSTTLAFAEPDSPVHPETASSGLIYSPGAKGLNSRHACTDSRAGD